jgi:hypothetical protein
VLTNKRFTVLLHLRRLLTVVSTLSERTTPYVIDATNLKARRNRVLIVRRVPRVKNEGRQYDSTLGKEVEGHFN